VIRYINQLKDDPEHLEKLKKGALDTARKWINWEESSECFYHAVRKLWESTTEVTQERMEMESKFHFQSYVIAEDYHNELKIYQEKRILKRIYYRVRDVVPKRVRQAVLKLCRQIVKILK